MDHLQANPVRDIAKLLFFLEIFASGIRTKNVRADVFSEILQQILLTLRNPVLYYIVSRVTYVERKKS